MENPSLQIGDNNWAVKDGSILGYNIIQDNYLPQPIDFTRASTATRVNESGLIESVATGVPRIDYTSGFGKLLLEPQRTNLLTYSEQFDNAAWLENGSPAPIVTANTTTSPDGTTNADTLVMTSPSAATRLEQSVTYASGTYTISLYVKSLSGISQVVRLFKYDGTSETNSGDITVTTEWTRITYIFTSVAGSGNISIRAGASNNNVNIAIYGFQAEQGSFPTSYIPTTSGTAVTRVKDTASKTGISSLIGQTEGVFYAEVDASPSLSVTRSIATIQDGSNYTRLRINTSSALSLETYLGGSFVSQVAGGIILNGTNKVAFCYKNGESLSLFLNGTLIATGPVVTTNPTGFTIRIGSDNFNSFQLSNGISQALLFKTRLTNAELATLTTI
jgi:hypothetical protein